MTPTLQEMKQRIGRFLAGQDSLEEFHVWMTAAAVAHGRTDDPEIARLVDAIDGLLLRLSAEELTESEFNDELRHLLPVVIVQFDLTAAEALGGIYFDPATAAMANATAEEVSA